MTELHRRRVFRTLAYYVVSAWLLLQAADVLFPAWNIPDSVIRYVLYAAVLGLPVALLFAWFYDVGPAGIQRTDVSGDGDAQPLRGRDYLLLGALLAVLGAIAYGTFRDVGQEVSIPGPEALDAPVAGAVSDVPVVAVLPFAASGEGEESELFAVGIHDDLLTQLSRLGGLRVISRTSVLAYDDVERNIREIGEALGASVVLEGFVRVAGERIRINAQLIDARSDQHLWAETFDRTLSPTNLFEVQSEIARSIADAMDTELSPAEQSDLAIIPTTSMAAYRAFRRAESGAGSNMSSPEFIEDLERAVELDPEFVRAWAELAGGYAYASRRPDYDREALLQRAEAALDRIAALAPNSVDHLFAQAYYVYYALSEYDQALALANRALELSPSDIRLLQLKSWVERRQGSFQERLATLDRLIQLEPLEDQRRYSKIFNLFILHRYDEAWALFEGLTDHLPPDSVQTRYLAATLGNRDAPSFDAYLARLSEDMERVQGSSPRLTVLFWQIAYASRDFEEALRIIDEIPPFPGFEQIPVKGADSLRMLTLWAMGDDLRLQGVVDAAQVHFESVAADQPELVTDVRFLQDVALLAFLTGDQERAVTLLRRWEVESLKDWAQRISFREAVCGVYGIMAMPEEAVDCLRRGLSEPSLLAPWMVPYQPEYDPVRQSPEFQALMAELEATRAPATGG